MTRSLGTAFAKRTSTPRHGQSSLVMRSLTPREVTVLALCGLQPQTTQSQIPSVAANGELEGAAQEPAYGPDCTCRNP